MNDSRTKRFRPIVPLQEYLEKIIELRFNHVDSQTLEAKRLMENTMSGFPELFVKKGDTSRLEMKVDDLISFKSQMEGKASQRSLVITLVISLVSLLIAGVVGIAALLRSFQY